MTFKDTVNKKVVLSFVDLLSFGIPVFAQTAVEFFVQGNAAFDRKAYDTAVILYSKAIQSDPKSPEIYLNCGKAFLKLEKFDDAIVDFSMAINLDPKQGEAYFNRGMARKLTKSPIQNYCEDLRRAQELGFPDAAKALERLCK